MRKAKRLIWQLYPPFLLITLLSLFAANWYTSYFFRDFFLQRAEADLLAQGRLLKTQIVRWLGVMTDTDLNRLCRSVMQDSETRLTLILPDGRVVSDSVENPLSMENHAERPEIRQALSGRTGTAIRYSETLDRRMMYVAVPLMRLDRVAAVVRTSLPVTAIDEEISSVHYRIVAVGFFIALLASVVCLWVAQRISRPILDLKQGAERFAAGDLDHRLRSPGTVEFAGLARSMNQMAIQLENRMDTAVSQRNEMEAVLSSMMEGVIAVNPEERIIRANMAACEIIGVPPGRIRDRSIQEVIRNRDLHGLIEQTLAGDSSVEGDITVYENGERILSIHCTPLAAADGQRIGTLIVFNDVTTLRRLENMRRDFAASVSHEIKTPLTAIMGFVETLSEGSIDDPEESRRFLRIIEKHVNRLTAILNDLIELSRIERDDENQQISKGEHPIRDVLLSAVQICSDAADERRIAVDLHCDESLSAKIDPTLMEQAFVNLIDNAVKYSKAGSRVTIRAEGSSKDVQIRFEDQGIGIAKKHLPRLFERFYRVDKARSRKAGGTGLGLAIVKHIVQAHGGQIQVESVVGEGTVFTVFLPG